MRRATESEIDLEVLRRKIKEARERKGMTLEELSHTLWAQGFPTSQNKLWRMENKPPRRLDSELLLWLEKILEVPLLHSGQHQHVLKDDVNSIIDEFIDATEAQVRPPRPTNLGLAEIYDRLSHLVERCGSKDPVS